MSNSKNQNYSQRLRSDLSISQCEVLNQFIKEVDGWDLTTEERKFCDEACLVRYLKARDFVLEKSIKMLDNSIQWRKSFKPQHINPKELNYEASSGKIYVDGTDKLGRPILWITSGRENSSDWDKNLKLTVFSLEEAIRRMKSHPTPGVQDKIVLMMDFSGYSTKSAPPFAVSREVLNILTNHYPERLGVAYMCNTPFIFNMFWKLISPFLHPVTREKIQFIRKKHFNTLKQVIDKNTIQKRFEGDKNEPNMKEYWNDIVDAYIERTQKRSSSSQSLSRHSSLQEDAEEGSAVQVS